MDADIEIIKSGKCGNSPKNAFVEDFAIWLITADQDKLARALSPDKAIWAEEHRRLFDRLSKMRSTKITIFDAISHGRIGAARGKMSNNSGSTEFSVFVEFQNTTADQVRSAKVYFA